MLMPGKIEGLATKRVHTPSHLHCLKKVWKSVEGKYPVEIRRVVGLPASVNKVPTSPSTFEYAEMEDVVIVCVSTCRGRCMVYP